MTKSWIKLTKSGTIFGLAHFIGDVVEVSAEKYKEVMSAGGCVPAEQDEIEAAKIALEKANTAEVAAKALAGPTTSDLMAEIQRLRQQLAEKDKK